MTRTIGALVFDGFELLDLYGPLEMFGLPEAGFEISLIAQEDRPIRATHGPRALPDAGLGGTYDLLLVPGGRGTRREVDNDALISAIRDMAAKATVTASVCTGAALLARAGVLDGLKATTNKRAFDWVRSQGPQTDWQPSARWVKDGNVWTSSGVSAGTDMSLAIIAEMVGEDAARETAHHAEYVRHTDPDDDPFALEYLT